MLIPDTLILFPVGGCDPSPVFVAVIVHMAVADSFEYNTSSKFIWKSGYACLKFVMLSLNCSIPISGVNFGVDLNSKAVCNTFSMLVKSPVIVDKIHGIPLKKVLSISIERTLNKVL